VFDPSSPVTFVALALEDANGKTLSTNFYWLSAKKNVYDWSAEDNDAFTPVKSYEDFTALNSLPSAGKIKVVPAIEKSDEGPVVRVTLQNTSDRLAFQLRVGIQHAGQNKDDGAELLPVVWDDNYISLLPGETREITAQFFSYDALYGDFNVRVTGWNIEPASIPLTRLQGVFGDSGESH
jgi:exo-1,4-beta-D-glucosaminidase